MAKGERANLLSEFREFRGQINEWKNATNKRLEDNNATLNEIRNKLNEERPFCSAHAEIVKLIDNVKSKGEGQDKDITDLKVKGAVIEYKLGTRDLLKVSGAAGILGTIILAIVQIILQKFGG